jgi:cytochrome P450
MHEPDVFALSRFKDVQLALRSPAELISGDGVGFNPVSNERRAEPSTITSDGERHRRLRGQVSRPLMPAALKERRADLKAIIAEQVQAVKGQGWIDGVQMLAQHLPVSAISFLVGLPDSGRANMLRWASAGFNFLGPHVEHLEEDLAAIREARQYLLDVNPDDLLPGSWSRSLFDSVEQGKLTIGEARAGLSGLVLPSLDTTIYASGNLLHNLGAHPDQWALLKERRELIPSAVVESVRHSAVVRWFSRVAVTDYQVEDITIPAGSRVMLMYGSANRDERRYENPDQFDVTRNPQDQLGWGTGPHMCAGMHLAKLEMEVLLEALLDNVDSVEVGEPVVGHSQGLYGFDRLPMRIH